MILYIEVCTDKKKSHYRTKCFWKCVSQQIEESTVVLNLEFY